MSTGKQASREQDGGAASRTKKRKAEEEEDHPTVEETETGTTVETTSRGGTNNDDDDDDGMKPSAETNEKASDNTQVKQAKFKGEGEPPPKVNDVEKGDESMMDIVTEEGASSELAAAPAKQGESPPFVKIGGADKPDETSAEPDGKVTKENSHHPGDPEQKIME